MIKKFAVAALGALIFSAGSAAAANSHHRAAPQVRHGSHVQGTYGYAPHREPQSAGTDDIYWSYSQGRQSYPNPDREFNGPYSHSY